MELIETATAVEAVPMAYGIKRMMKRIVVYDPLPAGSGDAAEIGFIEQTDAVSIQCSGRKGEGNGKPAAPRAGTIGEDRFTRLEDSPSEFASALQGVHPADRIGGLLTVLRHQFEKVIKVTYAELAGFDCICVLPSEA